VRPLNHYDDLRVLFAVSFVKNARQVPNLTLIFASLAGKNPFASRHKHSAAARLSLHRYNESDKLDLSGLEERFFHAG
jgi:hypothetical protein